MQSATGMQISTLPVSHKPRSCSRSSSDCASSSSSSSEMHDLLPCKVRRNYLCKDCNYCTTNPREFLYHQRDFHGQKGNIHECPYCLYASPHSHKLNRHITIIHSASRMLMHSSQAPTPPQPPPPPPPLRPMMIQRSAVRLPQSSLLRADLNIPSELEIILVDDDGGLSTASNGATGGSLSSLAQKTVRSVVMEPSVVLVPIPPPPKLTRPNLFREGPRSLAPSTKARPVPRASSAPKALSRPTLIQKAIRTTIQEYSCSLCSFKSKSRILVQRHERVSHLKKKFFRCTKCNYVTNVRSRYTKHLRYHNMPYIKCTLCDFSTPYKWNLDRHNRHHMDGSVESGQDGTSAPIEDNPFRCERCSFLGSSGQSLNMHMLNHHGGKPRPRRIESEVSAASNHVSNDANHDDVGGYDEDGGYVESHRDSKRVTGRADTRDESHETDSSAVYTCNECRDRFSSRALRDRHMYECHNIDGSPCGPPSKNRRTTEKRLNLRCDKCSYKAKWISELIKHKRVHTRDKPFTCSHCDFRCRWKGDMTRHMMKYHNASGDNECGGNIVVKSEPPDEPVTDNIECLLDQSMMVGAEDELLDLWSAEERNDPLDLSSSTSHDEDDEDNLESDASPLSTSKHALDNGIVLSGGKIVRKKYQCPHCNFLTPVPSRFHMHFVAHINPKPFMCSVCGYRSNWQWDITKHAKMKSLRDPRHLSASVSVSNEYGSNNYERYEQYAVYETDNSSNQLGRQGKVSFNNIDNRGGVSNSNASFAIPNVARKVTYKCKYCNFKNPVKKTVMRHMVVHSTNKAKRFWCGVCGQASNWKHVILRHCHHVHGTSGPILLKDSSPASPPNSEDVMKATSKNFVDDDCDDLQGGAIHAKDEANSGEEGKEKTHKCSICPYQCQKVFDLRIHSYLHRPRDGAIFKCMFCPFYVSLKRSWLNHMRLHVDRPQEYAKKFLESARMPESSSSVCDSSQAGFRESVAAPYSSLLNDQVPDNTDGPEGVPRVWVSRSGEFLKMFKCRHCPHVSKKRAVIMTHEKMHRKRKFAAGKPTYKCPHCNYTSKNAGVLTSHQKVHAAKDTVHSYVCDDESYSTNGSDARAKAKSFLGESSQSMLSSSLSATSTIEDGKFKIKITKTGSGGGSDNKSVVVQNWLKPTVSSAKSPKVYHSCGQCPAKFNKLHQMLSHRTFHGADLPWRCASCNYAARHRPHLHKHERVHTPEYLKTFMRPLKRYKDIKQQQQLTQLQALAPNTVPKKELSAVNTTPKSSSGSGERKHQCQMCPATFLKYSTLIYHMHLHNNNGKFKCPQCTYSVSNIGNLARHIKVHTCGSSSGAQASEQLPPRAASSSASSATAPTAAPRVPSVWRQKVRYSCSKCPAVFDKQIRFGVHMTLHGSTHRFRCDKCDYAVKFAAILTRHKALHENHDENVSDAPCTIPASLYPSSSSSGFDGASFVQATGVGTIVGQESKPPMMSIGTRPHVGLTQVERQQLILHQLQSRPPIKNDADSLTDPKKLFCCDRCPYINQRKDAVQSHLKRHIPGGRESTMCPHCDYGTSIHSFLREHVKLHFKPSRNQLPEAFVKLDEFQICVLRSRSSSSKTLVFKFPLDDGNRQFDDEDITEIEDVTTEEEEDNISEQTSAGSSVEDVVRELVHKVEIELANDGGQRRLEESEGEVDTESVSTSDRKERRKFVRLAVPTKIKSEERDRQTTTPLDIFKGMVGASSPNVLVKELESTINDDDSKEKREFLEFAMCLGFSS